MTTEHPGFPEPLDRSATPARPGPPPSRAGEPLSLPPGPADVPPTAFPVIATLAPLVVAGLIWVVTGSAFVLVFAVLGPVIGVAGLLDSRRTNRRRRRQGDAAHAAALEELRAAVADRHAELRGALWAQTPAAGDILLAPDGPGRWRWTAERGRPPVVLGAGTVPSGLRVDGAAAPGDQRELRDRAALLTEAPVTADPGEGIAIVGPAVLARALGRAVLVQLAFALPPGRFELVAPPTAEWSWTGILPHASAAAGSTLDAGGPAAVAAERLDIRPAGMAGPAGLAGMAAQAGPTGAWLVVAPAAELLPPGCGTIVRVHGALEAEVLWAAGAAGAEAVAGTQFRPGFVSREQAEGLARHLRERAASAGLLGGDRALPTRVTLGDVAAAGRHPTRSGLSCPIGIGGDGVVTLDLVTQGPHAIVGGTTGSGKSELLVTWVAMMATGRSPAEVTFLLIDFKGGAAFRPLCALPHCVGLITDLDGRAAARALASLGAELRHRERTLARVGARDLAELRDRTGTGAGAEGLPRLVILVDEFATMLTAFPELHALFVDIAARGRSLGVHLVLCTQRPTGVVRDSLLANCSLRLSLRVNNAADSLAVLGTDAAAGLSAAVPGRCLVATGEEPPRPCQVATTSEADILDLAGDGRGRTSAPTPRRPWLDPLPERVTGDMLSAIADAEAAPAPAPGESAGPGRGLVLGLLDEPERQRYSVAESGDGHLLVVGGARSGKTTLLSVLAEQATETGTRVSRPRADLEAVWDALVLAGAPAGRPPGTRSDGRHADATPRDRRLLLLDDFDSVCARWEPDHRQAALDLTAALLRDGLAAGLRVVITVQRLSGPLQALTALCQDQLLLRMPDVAAHLAAGGASGDFDPALPPGGGRWRGHRIQLLAGRPHAPGPDPLPEVAVFRPHEHAAAIVVSGAPARTAAALRNGGAPAELVELVELSNMPTLSAAPASGAGPVLSVGAPGRSTVYVGDADAWQAHWALLAALRTRGPIVFDGCGLVDYRMISRRRELPPPLAPGRGRLWVLSPDGTLVRARHDVTASDVTGSGVTGARREGPDGYA